MGKKKPAAKKKNATPQASNGYPSGGGENVSKDEPKVEQAADPQGSRPMEEANGMPLAPRASPETQTQGSEELPGQGDWEALKKEATERYMADDFQGAIDGYGLTIKVLESLKGQEPKAESDRKALAILYTNRAMAALQIVRRTQAANKCGPGATLPPDLRKLAMRANVDASNAIELDESNAKAWLRKGQALLWMSSLQQRAKEAMVSLERARDSPGLPASMKPEVAQWLKLAKSAFNEHTPMPQGCPQM